MRTRLPVTLIVRVYQALAVANPSPSLALDPDSTSNRIIIDDVTHYAYGQTEDRSVEIWVAGKAGWYLISPAKGYLPTFNRMVQAVDMLYFLIDRHQQGKKQINPTFKSLCRQVSSVSPLHPERFSAKQRTVYFPYTRRLRNLGAVGRDFHRTCAFLAPMYD